MSTQNIIFSIKKKITLNYPKSAVMGFFQETEERARNSHGYRAISVRAIEVLLYMLYHGLSARARRKSTSSSGGTTMV